MTGEVSCEIKIHNLEFSRLPTNLKIRFEIQMSSEQSPFNSFLF